jgi:hypothetical protein
MVAGVAVDVAIGATLPYPGYAATIGLVGCVLIVVVSKWLGGAFIQQPEDYYPDDAPPDRQPDLHGAAEVRDG